jgi:hypothetical protein
MIGKLGDSSVCSLQQWLRVRVSILECLERSSTALDLHLQAQTKQSISLRLFWLPQRDPLSAHEPNFGNPWSKATDFWKWHGIQWALDLRTQFVPEGWS